MFDRKGSFIGRWTFATLQLPEDLKSIPVEHSRSRVLVSVPGTDQATEAVLLAQAPKNRTGQRERNQSDGSRRRFGSATFTRLIFGTRPRTSLLSVQPVQRNFWGEVPRSMAHMAALEVGLPTTREQEHMLAGALSMGHTDPVGLHKRWIHARLDRNRVNRAGGASKCATTRPIDLEASVVGQTPRVFAAG